MNIIALRQPVDVFDKFGQTRVAMSMLRNWLTFIIIGFFVLATNLAMAIPGIQVESSGAHYGTALYEEVVTDIEVKVMGGKVRIQRQWKVEATGKWIFNPELLDLEVGAETIKRNGFAYNQASAGSSVYVHEERKTITRSDTGYRWSDRKGNWIDYDTGGKTLAYGDRNNVRVSFNRDTEGRIHQILDHFGKVVLTLTYRNAAQLASVVDYSGRKVIYTYANDDLIKVTDVRGYDWLYGYETLLNKRVLAKKNDPEGRVVNINHVVSPGGSTCVASSGGSWYFSEEKNRWEKTGGTCTKYSIEAPMLLFSSLSDEIGVITKNQYFFDAQSQTYHNTKLVNGRRVTQKINLRGEVVREEHGGTLLFDMETSEDHRRKVITDGEGKQTIYEFDGNGNQVKKIYPDQLFEQWSYDRYSNILTYTGKNGVKYKNEYDANGNLLVLVEAEGTEDRRTTRYTYDGFGQLTAVTTGESASGITSLATTRFEYDNYGNQTKVTDALGYVTTFSGYDALGNAHESTDARAALLAPDQRYTWNRTYDAAGNLVLDNNPYGQGITYTYNAVGDISTVVGADGSMTSHARNGRGSPQTVTDSNNQVTRFEYDSFNRPQKIVDPNGDVSRLTYTADGRLESSVDGEGNTIKHEYSDNLQSHVHYPTYTEAYGYDSHNRVTEVAQKANNLSYLRKIGYDIAGNVNSRTDTGSKSETYFYDSLNRLAKIIDAAGFETKFLYDARDNLLQVADSEGRLTLYTYDQLGQLVSETKHDDLGTDKQRLYEYDATGNLISQINPKHEKLTYQYDRANRAVGKKIFASKSDSHPVKVTSYIVNNKSQWTGYSQSVGVDGNGVPSAQATPDTLPLSETYTYTTLNQIDTVVVDFGSFQKSYSYTYRPDGLKRTYTNPEGVTYTYHYSKAKQLIAVDIPGKGQIGFSDFKWTAPQKTVLPGGSHIAQTYDDLLNVKAQSLKDPAGNEIASALYELDMEGNVVKAVTGQGGYIFDYDPLYQLRRVDYPVGSEIDAEHFEYDGVGNRVLYTVGKGGQTSSVRAVYGNHNQLLSRDDDSTFTYNENGHTEKRIVNTVLTEYVYNHEERLIEVREAGATLGQYAYNPKGQRILKMANGQTTYFLYNGEGLAAEYDSNGKLLKEYFFKPNGIWMSTPLFQRSSEGEVYFYQNNYLGTPERMFTANGSVVWEATYGAFGKAHISIEEVENHLRFSGQYFDEESGLHHNYSRDYDSALGRYVQSDPIGLADGPNTYGYARQNPIHNSDPFGLFCVPLPSKTSGWSDGTIVGPINYVYQPRGGFGAVTCYWLKKAKKRQVRVVQERELCYDCENDGCIGETCSTKIRYGEETLEERDTYSVIDRRHTRGWTTGGSYFGANPETVSCPNPWTGKLETGPWYETNVKPKSKK